MDDIHLTILREGDDEWIQLTGLIDQVEASKNTVYRRRDDLLEAGYLEEQDREDGPGSVYRATESGQRVLKEAQDEGSKSPNLPVDELPTEPQRRVAELVLAAATARQSQITSKHHATFYLFGPTASGKSTTAEYIAALLTGDVEAAERLRDDSWTESGRGLFRRRAGSEVVEESKRLEDPLTIFDDAHEIDDPDVFGALRTYLQGRLTIQHEDDQIRVHPVPIVIEKRDEGENDTRSAQLHHRLAFESDELRRGIPVSFYEVPSTVVADEELLDRAASKGPFKIPNCKLIDSEVLDLIETALERCLEDGDRYQSAQLLRVLASGLRAYMDSDIAALERTLEDYFICVSTLGWTVEDWADRLTDLIDDYDGAGASSSQSQSVETGDEGEDQEQNEETAESSLARALSGQSDADQLQALSGPAREAAVESRRAHLKQNIRQSFNDMAGVDPEEVAQEENGPTTPDGTPLDSAVDPEEAEMARQLWFLYEKVPDIESIDDLTEFEAVVNEVIERQEDLGHYQEQLEDLSDRVQSLESQEETLRVRIEELNSRQEELKAEKEAFEAELEKEQEKLEDVRAKRQEEESRLRALRHEAGNQETINELLDACHSQGTSPDRVLEELDAHSHLKDENRRLHAELAAGRKRLASIEDQIEQKLGKFDMLEEMGEYSDPAKEIIKRHEDIREFAISQGYAGYDSPVDALADDLERASTLSRVIGHLQEVIGRLENDIEELSNRRQGLSKQIADLDRTRNDKTSTIRELQGRIDDLTNQINDLEQERDRLKDQVDSLYVQIALNSLKTGVSSYLGNRD
jgi:predicted  nucleic acid-binding Zn-ribbon protein